MPKSQNELWLVKNSKEILSWLELKAWSSYCFRNIACINRLQKKATLPLLDLSSILRKKCSNCRTASQKWNCSGLNSKCNKIIKEDHLDAYLYMWKMENDFSKSERRKKIILAPENTTKWKEKGQSIFYRIYIKQRISVLFEAHPTNCWKCSISVKYDHTNDH